MSTRDHRLLIVDDEPDYCLSVSHYLTRRGFVVHCADSIAEARARLISQIFEGIVLDMRLPDGDGLDFLPDLRSGFPEMGIVVATGNGDVPVAVEAMRRGANHFVTKPFDPNEVEAVLRRCIELVKPRQREIPRLHSPEPFVGAGPASRAAIQMAEIAAQSDSPVLLTGETGTGKGVLARWIHEHGPRRQAKFVEINCSAIRGELLASELFGHARGAFTSAVENRAGLLDVADGGTLFLDEIGDMDPAIQGSFLKVVEEKWYRRVGEVTPKKSDFRLICATNSDLAAEVAARRFRADLLFRINVLPIELPPLRSTPGNLAPLIRHLLNALGAPHATLTLDAARMLEAHTWPGNIRELQNVLHRAIQLSRDQVIGAEHLSGLKAAPRIRQPEEATAALTRCEGDKARAARELGISRATLYRRLRASKQSH